ncbi:MAG: hypothetical protein WCH11_04255, partial [Bdellovibrio sp.]
MSKFLRELFTQHLSSKAVALMISLILWVTILGRRDFVVTKDIEVEVNVPQTQQVLSVSTERVRVKVSGSRNNLRRFIDSGASQVVIVDASSKLPGKYDLPIPTYKLDLPFGV